MSFLKSLTVLGSVLAAILPSATGAQDASRNVVQEEANRTLVVEFYDRLFDRHETVEAAAVVADDYIQHKPEVPDGKEPFVFYFSGFFAEDPQSKARVVRSAADSDLV